MLNKLMMGTALAVLLASPAVAQSFDPAAGTGNIVRNPSVRYSGIIMPNSFRDAYAYEKPGYRDRFYNPPWEHRRYRR
jgi:hypothetical protein